MKEYITLREYNGEAEEAAALICAFWLAHNDYVQSAEEAGEDLAAWTAEGHKFYFIEAGDGVAGFVHVGSRGARIDWIEDLFIRPEYQGKGYGSAALERVEELVSSYSDSVYIEVAARNLRALKLYHKNGYNCLNTVTIRKDFHPENFDVVREDELLGYRMEVRRARVSE